MPKFARSDELKVSQFQIKSKAQKLQTPNFELWHSFDIWILKFGFLQFYGFSEVRFATCVANRRPMVLSKPAIFSRILPSLSIRKVAGIPVTR